MGKYKDEKRTNYILHPHVMRNLWYRMTWIRIMSGCVQNLIKYE